ERHRLLHVELFFRFQLLPALLRPGDAPFRVVDPALRFREGARARVLDVLFAGIGVEQREVLAALLPGSFFVLEFLPALGFARLLLRGAQYGRVLAYQRARLVQLLRVATEALRRRHLRVIDLAPCVDALVHALLRRCGSGGEQRAAE